VPSFSEAKAPLAATKPRVSARVLAAAIRLRLLVFMFVLL
jgi:hypothetical protein